MIITQLLCHHAYDPVASWAQIESLSRNVLQVTSQDAHDLTNRVIQNKKWVINFIETSFSMK